MKPTFEKLVLPAGDSFRCFDRSALLSPVKWHRHPEIELTYVEQGAGSRLVGDHIGTYGDEDLVLLGSELPHTWLSDEYRGQEYDRHQAFVIQFHPHFLGTQFFAAPELADIAHLLHRAEQGLWFPPEVAAAVGQRMQKMVSQGGFDRMLSLLYCLRDLVACDSPTSLSTRSYSAPTNAEMETRITEVCDFITCHLSDPELSHATLAEISGMNPSAFSRFFKQATGRTVSDYINELRIGLACRLLVDTDESVLNVSIDAGFANVSNFNRRFKQLRHLTPREYRNRLRVM